MISLIANNLQEAMHEVKSKLGPNATIVSWRNLGDKIEVTATSNETKSQGFENGRDGFAQTGLSPRYDVFKHEEELQAKEKAALKASLLQQAQKMKSAPKEKSSKTHGIDNLVKAKPTKSSAAQMAKPKEKLHDLVPILAKSGLSLKEIKPFAQYLKDKNPRETLIEILDAEFDFKPIQSAPNNAIALVGPAGCGKTITAAKLAARALSSDAEVLIISTDTERQGGVEQLKMLAKKLGCGFNFADNSNIARNLVHSGLDAGKVVIIDCAAATPIEPASMRVLQNLIEDTKAEPVFCAPCDFRHDDLRDLAIGFGEIGAKRAILTRFDLTKRRAGFINAFHGLEYAFSQASASPFIAGGLVPASAKRLAGLILDAWED